MRLLQRLCVRSLRLPAVLVLMLALFVWVESRSLAEAPQPSVASLAVSPLSPDRERALQPKDTFTECAKCPEMVVVPAGKFMMGSPAGQGGDVERPQHEITFAKPFAVSKFEVTFDDWDACVAYGDCNPEISEDFWGRGRQPVINVSRDDAKHYAAWLSTMTGKTYRLLSEAEWEYAARAGTQTDYSWGDEIGENHANCYDCRSRWNERPTPVGSFAPNAFDLYDMHGNVEEWIEDCFHEDYEGAPEDGSAWTAGGDCNRAILRGGSWKSDPVNLRSAGRNWGTTDRRDMMIGFRVGRTLAP